MKCSKDFIDKLIKDFDKQEKEYRKNKKIHDQLSKELENNFYEQEKRVRESMHLTRNK